MAASKIVKPKPIQAATINLSGSSLEIELLVDRIRSVIATNRIEETPVVVIAIAGKSRRGKSFLLSVMIAYLEHMSKSPSEPFAPSSSDISGMTWARGSKAVTKGIWLWEKAYTITRKDNSKAAVLFLDTQGICDAKGSARKMVDSKIIYITLSMATIYIHNVGKDFQMPEKQVYQICKSFSEGYCEGVEEPLFNSFTLIIRDWTDDNKYGSRPDILKGEIEDSCDEEEAYKIMKGIDRMFENKTSWAFPVPSKALREGNGNLSLAEAGAEFQDCVLAFLKALFSPEGEYSKHMDHAVSGKEFVEILDGLSHRLSKFPDLKSEADQLKDLILSKTYHSANKVFENSLKSINSMLDLQALKDNLGIAENAAMECFQQQEKKYKPDDPILNFYLGKLRKSIEGKKKLRITEKELEDAERARQNAERQRNQAMATALGIAAVAVTNGVNFAGPETLQTDIGEALVSAIENPAVQETISSIGNEIATAVANAVENPAVRQAVSALAAKILYR